MEFGTSFSKLKIMRTAITYSTKNIIHVQWTGKFKNPYQRPIFPIFPILPIFPKHGPIVPIIPIVPTQQAYFPDFTYTLAYF